MESTTDFDLEELESRLYSQVFHSTENWDSQSATQNENLNNIQRRHVSPYTVSNAPVRGNRYWGAKTNHIPEDQAQSNEENNSTTSKENIAHEHVSQEFTNTESTLVDNTLCQQNANQMSPLETTVVQEYRTKPLRYKSFVIPTTLKLPKANKKKIPNHITNYFNLSNPESIRKFRSFLRYVERSQKNNNKTNTSKSDSASETSPPQITITSNGIDRSMKLSDIPIPVNDVLVLPNRQKMENDTEVIILSDSDSDSVIEVPLPPIPVYNVDSSSESDEEKTENISYKVPCSPKKSTIKSMKNAYINPAAKQHMEKNQSEINNQDKRNRDNTNNENNIELQNKMNDNSTEKLSLQDCETNAENLSEIRPADLNISFTELEKERDDFLHTPDSNTNDFLENDVSSLNRSNFCFNFGLHSSELDLSKDKEEPTKPGPSTNDHDLYETESSCSEIGSVISKSRPVFNEINFESPTKDIFCEPDLSKFSNFITPNRNEQLGSQQNKARSNIRFSPIQTKACGKIIHEEEETNRENNRRSRTDSSEYHSDATTLKVKKKNKKARKKSKKKEKLIENKNMDSAITASSSTEAQSMEIHSEVASTSSAQIQVEETISKTNSPINTQNNNNSIKSFSPSKQIDSTHFIDPKSTNSDKNETATSAETSNQKNSTSPLPDNQNSCSSVAEYYVDTYFADDCLLLEELEKQTERPGNNIENKQEDNPSLNNSTNISPENETVNKETSDVNFSFVDTWRKSTDNLEEKKSADRTEKETTPTKKIKTDNSPTIHPYVVTIESSNDDSESSEISVGKNEVVPRTVIVDEESPDLIIVNVTNDKRKSSSKKTSPNKNIVANPFSFLNTYLQSKENKSFRDFWTNDLTKFYDESWGQENFDMEKVQSSMSEKSSDWKIIPTDVIRFSPNRKGKGPYCKYCREYGHMHYNCLRITGPTKCSTCGSVGHRYTRCPESFCTTCRNPTAYYTTHCGYCVNFKNVVCNLCKNVGHEMKFCPDLWRRYHLTTDSNTDLNTSLSVLKSPDQRWCSNCARRGHCADKCSYLQHVHFPTTPGIISYVPTYDEEFKLPLMPPVPNIPIFKEANVTIADLRTIRHDVIESSNKKYMNILKQLRQQCNKYDFELINQIDRLRRNMNNQAFGKKQIQEIHRIRARVVRNKIL